MQKGKELRRHKNKACPKKKARENRNRYFFNDDKKQDRKPAKFKGRIREKGGSACLEKRGGK